MNFFPMSAKDPCFFVAIFDMTFEKTADAEEAIEDAAAVNGVDAIVAAAPDVDAIKGGVVGGFSSIWPSLASSEHLSSSTPSTLSPAHAAKNAAVAS